MKFYIICSPSEWGPDELLIAASVCLNALCAQYCTFILNSSLQFTEHNCAHPDSFVSWMDCNGTATQYPEDKSSAWNSG